MTLCVYRINLATQGEIREMFEKEAEEFADCKKSFWRQGRTCIDSVIQAFQKGAEFAYNKANEWHYPLRLDENDNPIADNPIAESYPVEICMYDFNSGNREIIKYDTAWGYYRKDGSSISQNHIAWQYLSSIPPKEA